MPPSLLLSAASGRAFSIPAQVLACLTIGLLNYRIETLNGIGREGHAHLHPDMNGKPGCSPIDWEDVRFFAALARHRTVAATARTLEVTHAAVTRRLASLETRLGSPLFIRRARGFSLTSTGVAVLAEAAQMEMAAGAVAQMCTGIFPRTVSGIPTLTHRSSRR